MSPKNLTVLILSFFIFAFAEAQTVKVKKENARVKGENTAGFEVNLESATAAEVSPSLVKFLKAYGKVKQSADGIVVNEPNIKGLAYTVPFFAVVKESGKNASAWLGIRESEWPKADVDKVNKELEKLAYEFGVKFYRDRIQVQIDESTRAVQAVDKQKQRLVNENKTLNAKLESNKREKIQLEKSLANNKLEYETLLKKIDQNKKAQDSVAVAGGQVKKVVEMHKERQRKVN
jgi:hypothetical protein